MARTPVTKKLKLSGAAPKFSERWKIFFIDTNTVICVPTRLRSGSPVPRVADQPLPLHSAKGSAVGLTLPVFL